MCANEQWQFSSRFEFSLIIRNSDMEITARYEALDISPKSIVWWPVQLYQDEMNSIAYKTNAHWNPNKLKKDSDLCNKIWVWSVVQ